MIIGNICLLFAVALGIVSFLVSLPELKRQQAKQLEIQKKQQKQQQ